MHQNLQDNQDSLKSKEPKTIANHHSNNRWPRQPTDASCRLLEFGSGGNSARPFPQFMARMSDKHQSRQNQEVLTKLQRIKWPVGAYLNHTARAIEFLQQWHKLQARHRRHLPPMTVRCGIILHAIRPWELHHAVMYVINRPYGWQPLALTDTTILQRVIDQECDRLDAEAAALNPRTHWPYLPIVSLVRYGDLATASEDILIHQTNCVSCQAKGLARHMFRVFPYANTYQHRGLHAIPGTVTICGSASHEQWIANMNAQYYPGPPRASGKDDRQHRLQYFEQCLQALTQHINDSCTHPCSVAFPWRIGCGLAKGVWRLYSTLIMRWIGNVRTQDGHPPRVTVYQLHPGPGPLAS